MIVDAPRQFSQDMSLDRSSPPPILGVRRKPRCMIREKHFTFQKKILKYFSNASRMEVYFISNYIYDQYIELYCTVCYIIYILKINFDIADIQH